jgi:transposase
MSEIKPPRPERPRRQSKYDDAFKAHAVALVVDQGRKVKDVARDLGISEFLLYEWRRLLRPGNPPAANPGAGPIKLRSREDLEAENLGLRRELEYVRQQRDILKKPSSAE